MNYWNLEVSEAIRVSRMVNRNALLETLMGRIWTERLA